MAELEAYDPNVSLRRLAQCFLELDPETRARFNELSYHDFARQPGLERLQAEAADFLRHFGHLSESGNDFSAAPWRETPDLVLQMVRAEAALLEDVDRHSPRAGSRKVAWEDLAFGPVARMLAAPLYRRARNFRLYREAVSSAYTRSYGCFRIYFLELGRRLAGREILNTPEEIFYLSWDEVKNILAQGPQAKHLAGQSLAGQAASRWCDMQANRDRLLPEMIYDDDLPPPPVPDRKVELLRGIPTARGYYRGPARVIRSLADFDRLKPGDVLIIPYSDVSWTTLFTRAGAVVAEAGGILSHSSIVAREFGIPCVVSVPGACSIPDDSPLAVDGTRGEIFITPLPQETARP